MEIDVVEMLTTLSKERSVEVQEGVFLKCSDRINFCIYSENNETIIDIGSPNVYIVATKFGKAIVTKFMKPVVDKIIITDTKYRIEAKPFGNIEFDRK